jgi:predicted nucleic acid-binding protein
VIRPASGPIHLDTSFLIRALNPTYAESSKLLEWLSARHSIAVSAVAWSEFLCGPIDAEDEAVARMIVQRHVPVGTDEASQAARLFNHGGRRRGSLPDCLIAATAILDGGMLATSNPQDFERFVGAGLELAE